MFFLPKNMCEVSHRSRDILVFAASILENTTQSTLRRKLLEYSQGAFLDLEGRPFFRESLLSQIFEHKFRAAEAQLGC